MKDRVAQKVVTLPPSGIRVFFDLVLNMKEVISLGVGEPDFVTPWRIREKAIYSLEQGETSYTSNKGLVALRKQIGIYLKRKFNLGYHWDEETLITVGVSEGLDLAIRAIVNPGDRVIVPQPSYVSYGPVVALAGGRPISVATDLASGFKLQPGQIDEACKKDKIKALMLNYPCNPTGASYSRTELLGLARVIKKHNLLVVSDEVYDELTYDFDHTPIASLPGMRERVIYLNGFSKAFAMTGFRLGWACGPSDIIAAMTKIHQYTMLCASITSQRCGLEALQNGARAVQDMKNEYRRRRRYIVTALNEIGLECHMPQGAFYVFPSVRKTGLSSLEFASDLLSKKKVALVPGVAFGECAEGHVRISYASSYENLKEAVSRIRSYLHG